MLTHHSWPQCKGARLREFINPRFCSTACQETPDRVLQLWRACSRLAGTLKVIWSILCSGFLLPEEQVALHEPALPGNHSDSGAKQNMDKSDFNPSKHGSNLACTVCQRYKTGDKYVHKRWCLLKILFFKVSPLETVERSWS